MTRTVAEILSAEARRRGRLGAAARNRNLTPEQRSELARVAARKRWAKAGSDVGWIVFKEAKEEP